MISSNNCKEKFLEDVTDVFFYSKDAAQLPIPQSVSRTLEMGSCKFGDAALHIALSEAEGEIMASAITVKRTEAKAGNGTIFTFEVSATLDDGSKKMPEICKNMEDGDYYMVFKQADGTLYLGYTLDNTFSITIQDTKQASNSSYAVTATAKAMSDSIPISLAQ